jgi:hypothetical protein
MPPSVDPGTVRERRIVIIPEAPADDPDDAVATGYIFDAELAIQMRRFIQELQTPQRTVGISAFLVFALAKRVRVFVWFGSERVDILEKYAPWIANSISTEAQFEAIACRVARDEETDERALHVLSDARETNHYVACIKDGLHESHGGGDVVDVNDDSSLEFHAIYLSFGRIVIETVGDGDCGVDVMTLMACLPRLPHIRRNLRVELSTFVLQHMGNRALVSCMFAQGEVTTHLGLFELAAAGALLLSHGGGDNDVVAESHGGGETPLRTFSDMHIEALKWKCNVNHYSAESAQVVLRQLPECCIEQLSAEYKSSSESLAIRGRGDGRGEVIKKAKFIMHRDASLSQRMAAASHFVAWYKTKNNGVLPLSAARSLKHGIMPYGWFSKYIEQHVESFGKLSHSMYCSRLRSYKNAVREFLSTVVERATVVGKSAVAEQSTEVEILRGGSNARQNFCRTHIAVRNYQRRRRQGGGRLRPSSAVAEALMLWYNVIRHSVDCKIMVRFPKKAFLLKALQLQQDYIAACLRNSSTPSHFRIDGRWLCRLLAAERISHRKPNRKYKVARVVLAQRLQIFWINTAKLRKLIQLEFGYDPTFRNADQSPFHMNEAGSQECNTLCLRGELRIPLIENHRATRERWSLNSVTDSSEDRVRRRLPGFEIMFRADGHLVERDLQEHVFVKGLPFKVTVVTGPSGSYRETDILAFLDNHLPKFVQGSSWSIYLLDAYAPGKTDNVQRLAWSRGTIIVTHGGGASCTLQTNDTNHHQEVRKQFPNASYRRAQRAYQWHVNPHPL